MKAFVGSPMKLIGSIADPAQHLVIDAVFLVQHDLRQQAHDRIGRGHRQDQRQPRYGLEERQAGAVQQDRDAEAKGDLDGNGDEEQRRGAAHRLPEDRVGQHLAVVRQPDELFLRALGQVEIVEAFPERIEQRQDADHRQRDHGGSEKGEDRRPADTGRHGFAPLRAALEDREDPGTECRGPREGSARRKPRRQGVTSRPTARAASGRHSIRLRPARPPSSRRWSWRPPRC